jgi:predicted nucleotidyltransferase
MIDVEARHRDLLLSLIARHLPGTAVWAFGSRITGTSRPSSDLDLVVFSPPEASGDVDSLREAFDESDLPFRVDLLEWESLPENFRRVIAERHEILAE